MNNEIYSQIIEGLLSVILLVITGVLLPEVKKWVQSKTEDKIINTAITELTRQVDIAVNYVEQTMVYQLKKDNKWDTKNQKKALDKAVDVVLANLSQTTLDYLQKNSNEVINTITQYIEANILSKHNK